MQFRAEAWEADRRVRWGAFAMGQHQRLGARSLVQVCLFLIHYPVSRASMSCGVPLLESESEFSCYPHYPHQGLDADVAQMILDFGASYDSRVPAVQGRLHAIQARLHAFQVSVERAGDLVEWRAVLWVVVAAVATVVLAVDLSAVHWMVKVVATVVIAVAVATVVIAVDESWVDGSWLLRMVKAVAAVVTVAIAREVIGADLASDWVDGSWVPWMVRGVAGVAALAMAVSMVLDINRTPS